MRGLNCVPEELTLDQFNLTQSPFTLGNTSPIRQWYGVLFSSESRFHLKKADGRVRVWHHRVERYNNLYILSLDVAACVWRQNGCLVLHTPHCVTLQTLSRSAYVSAWQYSSACNTCLLELKQRSSARITSDILWFIANLASIEQFSPRVPNSKIPVNVKKLCFESEQGYHKQTFGGFSPPDDNVAWLINWYTDLPLVLTFTVRSTWFVIDRLVNMPKITAALCLARTTPPPLNYCCVFIVSLNVSMYRWNDIM